MLKRMLFPKYPTLAGLKKDSQDYNGAGRIPKPGGRASRIIKKTVIVFTFVEIPVPLQAQVPRFYSIESIFETLHLPIRIPER
jgi:hypothetical protein